MSAYEPIVSTVIVDPQDGDLLAVVEPATPDGAEWMLGLPVGDEGRSNWLWITLPSGDLVFGCIPQGEEASELSTAYALGR